MLFNWKSYQFFKKQIIGKIPFLLQNLKIHLLV